MVDKASKIKTLKNIPDISMNGALELADSGVDNDISENVSKMKILALERIFIIVFVVDLLIKVYFQFVNVRNRDFTEKSQIRDNYDKE